MTSRRSVFVVVACLVGVLVCAVAPAQGKQEKFLVPIPEKIERATVLDDQGMLQWAEYEAMKCVNCQGRKTMQCQHCLRFEDHEACAECEMEGRAPCRVCAGTGEMQDILEHAPCPSCSGAGLTRCYVCAGEGSFPVEGGGKKKHKCGCCKGVGAFPCASCKGKREVETPKLKPSVAEAKVDDLRKALEALEKVRTELEGFESTRDGRKDIKVYAAVIKPGTKYFPVLKRAKKHFETASKGQTKGAVWTKYEDTVAAHSELAKHNLDYYLEHQKRLLELCLARAEHNEQAGGKK